ncbi:sensor histidine kinase [Microbacterium sp. ZW T5_45]|uniref:sensor histidine kinase n=1 Tax=Microbacterium sp. ZW T5_45 TaxID=3378080 RepID=UPI003854106E
MVIRSRLRSLSRRTAGTLALAAAGAVLFAVLVPIHAVVYGTSLPVVFLLGSAVCAAPVLSSTRPRTAIAMFCVSSFALSVLVSTEGGMIAPWPWSVPALLSFVLLVGTVTFTHGPRLGLFPLVIGALSGVGALLVRPDIEAGGAAAADLIVTTSISIGALLIAVLIAGRLRIGDELSREREHTALEQARRALVEERTRIARELHDVIAHSMSVIQVQASTARYRLPGLEEAAVAEFESIAATARGSLTEMRRMLGVLRTEDHSAELAPQHGIDDVEALVDSIRRAGAIVGLDVTGSTSTAPASVQIATYRIVQECLSNALRHSPGAPIAVRIRTDADAVRLRIENGPGAPASSPAGGGHGLRGMRERAEILGGSLDAAASDDGGWTVVAEIPLAPRQENA